MGVAVARARPSCPYWSATLSPAASCTTTLCRSVISTPSLRKIGTGWRLVTHLMGWVAERDRRDHGDARRSDRRGGRRLYARPQWHRTHAHSRPGAWRSGWADLVALQSHSSVVSPEQLLRVKPDLEMLLRRRYGTAPHALLRDLEAAPESKVQGTSSDRRLVHCRAKSLGSLLMRAAQRVLSVAVVVVVQWFSVAVGQDNDPVMKLKTGFPPMRPWLNAPHTAHTQEHFRVRPIDRLVSASPS